MTNLKIELNNILVRYNVKKEKAMSPEEAAAELYPKDKLIQPIARAIFEGEEDDVVHNLQKAIAAGKDPIALINDALKVGMDIVTKLYDENIIFLPNVILSSDAMLAGIEYCKSKTTKSHISKGKVLCHVAEGDVHDIGKNIVVAFLRSNGYEVVDLGRDVPVDEVVKSVKAEKPIMITGTALMTTTMYAFKKVNDKLLAAGINVPFQCGGGAVNQDFVSTYKLGVYGKEATDATKMAQAILDGKNLDALKKQFHIY